MTDVYPTIRAPESFDFIGEQSTIVSRSPTGRGASATVPRQFWRARFRYSSMPRAVVAEFEACEMKQDGAYTPVLVSIPGRENSRGNVTTTPAVACYPGYAIGVDQIVIDSLTPGQATALLGSDLLTFAGHTKAYMVSATVNAGASDPEQDETGVAMTDESLNPSYMETTGQATLDIEPPLVAVVADDEVITVDGVQLTMCYDRDVCEVVTGPADDNRYSADLLEVY